MPHPIVGILGCFSVVLWLQNCAQVTREAKMDFVKVKSAISSSEIEITLGNSFIENYKNRVTIDVPFTVDKTDHRPHPAFLDGDFHLSGRAPEIGLPIVAEIKNAALEQEVVSLIRHAEGTGRPLHMVGVWRLWPEHVGKASEVQGEYVSPTEFTNPDHVFEIHPLTRVDNQSLLDSLHPVEGYSPARAGTVFRSLQSDKCLIASTQETTTIVTAKGQFNDVEFLLEIADDQPRVVQDGSFVNAAVLDLRGDRLVDEVRMVFLKDTPPERAVRGLRRGQRLHVFGLPRIDLSNVAWRTRHSKDNPELLNLSLPYEIIVVGVYVDRK
jgi:hypothetical protein